MFRQVYTVCTPLVKSFCLTYPVSQQPDKKKIGCFCLGWYCQRTYNQTIELLVEG